MTQTFTQSDFKALSPKEQVEKLSAMPSEDVENTLRSCDLSELRAISEELQHYFMVWNIDTIHEIIHDLTFSIPMHSYSDEELDAEIEKYENGKNPLHAAIFNSEKRRREQKRHNQTKDGEDNFNTLSPQEQAEKLLSVDPEKAEDMLYSCNSLPAVTAIARQF